MKDYKVNKCKECEKEELIEVLKSLGGLCLKCDDIRNDV